MDKAWAKKQVLAVSALPEDMLEAAVDEALNERTP
jgi:hypothetical protein